MTRSRLRVFALGGCGLLLLPVLGCAFAADLINPDFLRQVGFDPATIVPPAGKVVLVFVNDTERYARFHAYVAENAANIRAGTRRLWQGANAGGTASEAVDCPMGLVSPGYLGDNWAIDLGRAAVLDEGEDNETPIAYEGAPLIAEQDFLCGDLIEIRLIQTGSDTGEDAGQQDQEAYSFRVQVHPGR